MSGKEGRLLAVVVFVVVYALIFGAIFVPWMWLIPPSAKAWL